MKTHTNQPHEGTGPPLAPYSLAAVRVDPAAGVPLYRQIYEAIRRDILEGLLQGGQRLAATRVMADDLGISRNTVLEAIEQLIAEGYLTSRAGSGTFVALDLPDPRMRVPSEPETEAAGEAPELSMRGQKYRRWASASTHDRSRPFQLGRPALDRFPWKLWWRLTARRGREVSRDWLDYSPSAGYPPLRRALARYLHSARGLRCSPEQIVIVRGSQQGLDLAARVFLDPGDAVWMEDPGYASARAVLA
ncbi:MAG: PLP-dependent aminotransferase family protein, partial [Acidobacteriota bacterium]